MSTGGYAGSGGSSEGCPFQRESTRHTSIPAHRRSSSPPLCSPRQPTHIPECGPRKAPRRHDGPPPGTAQCGHALLFPSLSRIAGHPLPPPASSPSTFLPSWQGIPRRIRAFPLGKPYHQAFPLPCPCSPLIGVRKPHHDWLPCAPGTASPQPPLSSSPRCPAAPPYRSLPGPEPVPVGHAPTPPPSTAAPFRAFPPNRAVIPSYRLLLIFFRMVGKWIPIHNAVFGIHTAVFNLIYGILS